MSCRNCSQDLILRLHSRLPHRLGMGVGFEYCQCCGQARISKDLKEFREEYHDQGLNLVLIPSNLLTQLRMQADHFSVRGDLVIGKVARPFLSTEQHTGNCQSIE